jgi:tetratricopeptide (TPR) repeat protein
LTFSSEFLFPFYLLLTVVLLHETYRLQPPVNDPILLATIVDDTATTDHDRATTKQEVLMEHERTLDEYYSLYKNGNLHVTMSDDVIYNDEYNNGKDDAYEADVHVSIGMLYKEMDTSNSGSTSSSTLASSHFQQAIRLYEMSGDVLCSSMAIAKYNLFLLHMRDGDYRAAIFQYNDAIDVLSKLDITDFSSYDEYDDPSLLEELKQPIPDHLGHYQRLNDGATMKRNAQPKHSLIQATSRKTRKSNEKRPVEKSRQKAATTGIKGDESTIFVDLQHFLLLQQNHSQQYEL